MNLELIKLPQSIEDEARKIAFEWHRYPITHWGCKVVAARTSPLQYPHTMHGRILVPVEFLSVYDRLFKIVTMEDYILHAILRSWRKNLNHSDYIHHFRQLRERHEVLIDTFPKEPEFQVMHDTAMEYEAQCVLLLGAQQR